MDDVRPTQISYQEFSQVVGYEPNYVIQGFNILDEEKSARIIDFFGFENPDYHLMPSESDNQATRNLWQARESLDFSVKSVGRVEQKFLRKSLFTSSIGTCAICGKGLPIELLVAAHIKKRQACSREERTDVQNIVMPLCKLGCDELYERGYLGVDQTGMVVIGNSGRTTEYLREFLSGLDGMPCRVFTTRNAPYFEWHYEKILRKCL